MNKDKLKEKLIEFYEVVEELDQITKDYEWWREPGNFNRVEKLIEDKKNLVEKINEMFKQEEEQIKEPLLTEEERELLKNFCFTLAWKEGFTLYLEYVDIADVLTTHIDTRTCRPLFCGLKHGQKYTAKELGLWTS